MEQNSDEFIRSRYALYSFASRAEELGLLQSNEYSSHLRFDPKMLYQDFGLRELFAESAELIRGLEADLEYKSGGNHLPTWKKWLDRAYDLKKTAKTEFISKMDLGKWERMIRESENPRKLFSELSRRIADRQNYVIEKALQFLDNGTESGDKIVYSVEGIPCKKTFLSYAYDDKALSLALYFYFLFNGGYLFVDWMHNGRIDDPVLLKEILIDELSTSDQFLLLRTVSSELMIDGNHSIRQWCAWEIGNYSRDPSRIDSQYVVSFYSDAMPANGMLQTFRSMKSVFRGNILT